MLQINVIILQVLVSHLAEIMGLSDPRCSYHVLSVCSFKRPPHICRFVCVGHVESVVWLCRCKWLFLVLDRIQHKTSVERKFE